MGLNYLLIYTNYMHIYIYITIYRVFNLKVDLFEYE
jgi:hypothetical protein